MKSSRLLSVFLAAACLGTARAQDVAAGSVIDVPTPPDVRIRADLPYDEHERQKLDLYLPTGHLEKPRPVVVIIHGGGWGKGSKSDGRRLAFHFNARGYAVACINYRLSSDATFPAQLEDCKAAVRWIRSNATRFGIERDRVGLVGISAGAHLASLVGALNSSRMYETGAAMEQTSAVTAVCDFFGPVDLEKLYDFALRTGAPQVDEVTQLLGGDPHHVPNPTRAANVALAVDKASAPMLIIHGDRDTVIPLEQSRQLYDALVAQHVPVRLHIIHGAGHTGPAYVAPDILAIVDEFFQRTLRPTEFSGSAKDAEITESTVGAN